LRVNAGSVNLFILICKKNLLTGAGATAIYGWFTLYSKKQPMMNIGYFNSFESVEVHGKELHGMLEMSNTSCLSSVEK